MEKKVAIIIERADVALGGAERSVFELSKALGAIGLKADILAAKGQGGAKNIHILCQDAPGKRVGYSVFRKALKRYLAENHYDIIHSVLPYEFADVYQPRGGTYAESVLRNAASYRNKFVASYKKATVFANIRRSRLLRAERKLCQNPDGPVIVCLSKYVAEQFIGHYGISEERISIIPNGVKINKRIDADEADGIRGQIMAQLNLKEAANPTLFLFAANNFRLKGLGALIEAMGLARKQRPGNKGYLAVAGGGGTGKYRLLAKKLGVKKKIIFLGSIRHIQNVISVTDVGILPTFYDPSSRFILEALAANRPVITTKFNGAIDLFEDNRHGKVIDGPEDTAALAEAIIYFADRDNIQKASKAIIEDNLEEELSIGRVAKQLNGLYDSILEKRRQG